MVTGASTYVVNQAQRRVTRALAERVAATLDRPDGDGVASGRNLPAPIQACLTSLADAHSTTEVVALRGIAFDHFDDLPDTPVGPTTMLLPEHWTSGLVARLLGTPVGYAEEKDGALIHEVHPVRGQEQHLDLVVLDNHVVAHGRAEFRSRYDGTDRWMRRFCAVRGLPGWAAAMMPRPGVLPPLHELASGL